ncbi:MAG: hypothetical protein ABR540_18155 [Acidimicrobiales bacterium]
MAEGRRRGLNVAAIGVALVIGAVALLVGGGWAIVILEAGAALVVVVAFLIHNRKQPDRTL